MATMHYYFGEWDATRLYAGAGIVVDSEPRKEWLETALKFQPMFSALGLQTEQADVNLEEQL